MGLTIMLGHGSKMSLQICGSVGGWPGFRSAVKQEYLH